MSIGLPIHISDEQLLAFNQKGYVKFEQIVEQAIIHQLQNSIESICKHHTEMPDIAVQNGENNNEYIIAINNLLTKPDPVFSELLGSPLMLSIAQTICGNDFSRYRILQL